MTRKTAQILTVCLSTVAGHYGSNGFRKGDADYTDARAIVRDVLESGNLGVKFDLVGMQRSSSDNIVCAKFSSQGRGNQALTDRVQSALAEAFRAGPGCINFGQVSYAQSKSGQGSRVRRQTIQKHGVPTQVRGLTGMDDLLMGLRFREVRNVDDEADMDAEIELALQDTPEGSFTDWYGK